jgi:putative membrane-bound dehydrogenase-like protein
MESPTINAAASVALKRKAIPICTLGSFRFSRRLRLDRLPNRRYDPITPGSAAYRIVPCRKPFLILPASAMNKLLALLLPSLAVSLLPFAAAGEPKNDFPHFPPKSPAEAAKTFHLRPGFRIELAAAEPLLESPVAIDFDEDGRMYVAEFPEYNQDAGYKGKGRIRLLEDTQGTGRYDKSTIFVEGLAAPVALCCWDGGLFVGSVPDLLYFKDTKGTGKADVRRVFYTGFLRDAAGEAMLNSFQWRFDNRIHLSTNLAGGLVKRADRKDAKAVNVKGQGFVFDPRSFDFQLTSGGGQHGMSIDDWGRTFVCSNSDPMSVLLYDGRYLARNPFLAAPAAAVRLMPEGGKTKIYRSSPVEAWRAMRTKLRKEKIVPGSDEGGEPAGFFTGATGVTVFRGDAWPAECRGQLFVGEVSGNLVFRAALEPQGVGFVGKRIDSECEFLASTDTWFRPVQFANGPDGNLYVIDMYRELIEGAAFLPPQVLKHMDVTAGIDKGRIWRVAHENGKPYRKPQLSRASTKELVALLEHPNGWHRDTASRLLYERRDAGAAPLLRELLAKSTSPLGRMHSLYALAGLDALTTAEVAKGLADADPRVRVQALRLAESFVSAPAVVHGMLPLAEDKDIQVRYQAAFSLGEVREAEATQALARLARSDGADSWFQLAILSSATARGGALFHTLLADAAYRGSASGKKLLTTLIGQVASANRTQDLAAAATAIELLPQAETPLAQDLVRALANKAPASVREQLGQGRTGEFLRKLLADAVQVAGDEKTAIPQRVDAIRTLGLAKFVDHRDLFRGLLKLTQPPQVQSAALETLGRFSGPEIASFVLDAWPSLSPKLRASAVESLFSRGEWIEAFLVAVEKKQVGRGDVDPARLALLQAHPDAKIRERALKVLGTGGLARRPNVVAAYQKALEMPGEARRGKEVFKKNCSSCHRLEGIGTAIGADITAIRNRGKEAVMLAILDPNREVLPQFIGYVAVLDNGRIITGMITAETATSITLQRPDGGSETVLRINLEELRSTGLSFMPEGLENQVDLQSMADLLAYLNSIK